MRGLAFGLVGILIGFTTLSATLLAEPVAENSVTWLEHTTQTLLQGCRVRADRGTILFTPDGKGNYRALWTRDFAYMVENAGDLLDPAEVEAALRALIGGIRADGATPDRVQPDGVAVYSGGPADHPLGEPNLDNGPFLVIAVDAFLNRLPPDRARNLFREWSPSLRQAMDWVPRSASGLIWNNPEKPHSPYGFTDTIAKTGDLFFESLLYWDASQRLSHQYRRASDHTLSRDFRARARRIARNLETLWNPETGAFLAATKDCRQIDVWGNAFVIWLDLPLGRKREQVISWLVNNQMRFVRSGQIRHLVSGEYWQRLLAPVERERYQNGAYWATASGWMMFALAQRDPTLARQLWNDLIADFQSGGVCECINEGYSQLPSYVVSATNPLAAARRCRLERTRP